MHRITEHLKPILPKMSLHMYIQLNILQHVKKITALNMLKEDRIMQVVVVVVVHQYLNKTGL
jgi:hypothetical protein